MATDLDRLKAWMEKNGHTARSLRTAMGWRDHLEYRFRLSHPIQRPVGFMIRFLDTFGDEAFDEIFGADGKDSMAKYAAMLDVQIAVRKGILPKISTCSCHNCGKQANSYHHPSYHKDDRLFVIPLCDKCHQRHHKSGMELAPVRIAIAQP